MTLAAKPGKAPKLQIVLSTLTSGLLDHCDPVVYTVLSWPVCCWHFYRYIYIPSKYILKGSEDDVYHSELLGFGLNENVSWHVDQFCPNCNLVIRSDITFNFTNNIWNI
jgi:hypothetical protein